MIKLIIVVAMLLFVAVATVAQPELLAKNKFLDGFIKHEILSLLAVVLTVTLASVANIHMTISSIVRRVYGDDINKGQRKAYEVRSEINQNSWLLLWGFVVCVLLLFIKGMTDQHVQLASILNGLCLCILFANVLVLYDIYKTVYALASSDLAVHCGSSES